MLMKMTLKNIYRYIHKLGRSCLNCESWRSTESLLCPECLEQFCQRRVRTPDQIEIQGRITKCHALFDWVPDQNRCLSLLLKQLKGGRLSCASHYWGDLLTTQALSLKKRRRLQSVVLVPAPAKRRGDRDHAYLLAEKIAEITGWPIYGGLERSMAIETKSLNRSRRAKMTMQNHEKITANSCVIFVDDVVTTGSTAMAAKRALGPTMSFEIWCLARRRELATDLQF